jgi:hypothetical protein
VGIHRSCGVLEEKVVQFAKFIDKALLPNKPPDDKTERLCQDGGKGGSSIGIVWSGEVERDLSPALFPNLWISPWSD